jgi:hypothetical protein
MPESWEGEGSRERVLRYWQPLCDVDGARFLDDALKQLCSEKENDWLDKIKQRLGRQVLGLCGAMEKRIIEMYGGN